MFGLDIVERYIMLIFGWKILSLFSSCICPHRIEICFSKIAQSSPARNIRHIWSIVPKISNLRCTCTMLSGRWNTSWLEIWSTWHSIFCYSCFRLCIIFIASRKIPITIILYRCQLILFRVWSRLGEKL